jgi:hypothetical protein
MEGELRVLYVSCLAAVKSTFCYILGRPNIIRTRALGKPASMHADYLRVVDNLPADHRRGTSTTNSRLPITSNFCLDLSCVP